MELQLVIILVVGIVGCECNSRRSNYVKDPTFANLMCPADHVEFQRVTRSTVDCVWLCDRTPGCITLIYLHDNHTCFGIKLTNTFSTTSPLPGGVFYKQKSTPMVVGLPDSQFTASSVYSATWAPWNARINITDATWCPSVMDTNQWLQVDFSHQIIATHVMTKGSPISFHWLTSFKILTCTNCATFVAISDDLGNDKVFPGNTDGVTAVQHALEPPVVCRCLRINPVTWYSTFIALRLDVLGYLK